MPSAERERYDVIVAGAGHNGLVAAAYVAAAGLRVLLLEDRDVVGGNAVSEEFVPGYRFDAGASGHTFIQSTPILKNDELGLLAHGLRYEFPDPIQVVMLPDGSLLPVHVDVAATARNIAKISPADADAYRRMEDEAFGLMAVAGKMERGIMGEVDVSPAIRRKLSRRAWDVIAQRFTDPRIQSWLCKEASLVLVPPDQPWTARFVFGGYVTRHTPNVSWGTPIGGSGALTDALRDAFERSGGTVKVAHRVTRVLVEGGAARGVECADGTVFVADKAVISSMHIKHLVGMTPSELWPADAREAVDDLVTGPSLGVTYIAATEAPRYRGIDGTELASMAALIPGTLEESLGWGTRILLKKPALTKGTLFTHAGTVLDPSRAVPGGHTIKCVSFQPYELDGGAQCWDSLRDDLEQFHLSTLRKHAPNITPATIVGTHTRTPLDLERVNLHNVGGSAHGGEQLDSQLWDRRPAPGWADHRMPIRGLYQTGATTHPGGGIAGVSGRNAALVLLADLGVETGSRSPVAAGHSR